MKALQKFGHGYVPKDGGKVVTVRYNIGDPVDPAQFTDAQWNEAVAIGRIDGPPRKAAAGGGTTAHDIADQLDAEAKAAASKALDAKMQADAAAARAADARADAEKLDKTPKKSLAEKEAEAKEEAAKAVAAAAAGYKPKK